MRCITLGKALYSFGAQVYFLTNSGGEQVLKVHAKFPVMIILRNDVKAENLQIEQTIQSLEIDYFIWDSYAISEELEQLVSSIVPTMIVDDNYLLSSYTSDAILNQNIYADSSRYLISSETTVFAGRQYTLLRDSVLAYGDKIKTINKVPSNVLLTFGGSDEANDTMRCLIWLNEIQEQFSLNVTVVMGMHYTFEEELTTYASKLQNLKLFRNVINMADLLWKQDVVVTAAGSTMYELAFLGLPSCSLVTADNQVQVAETFVAQGTTINLGLNKSLGKDAFISCITRLLASYDLRSIMSSSGRNLIDGLGSSRVAQYIMNR
jgi:UDP-2,4-diacetamido-2,4,6-trideoxy-beta-L-altropyranose hydrolase